MNVAAALRTERDALVALSIFLSMWFAAEAGGKDVQQVVQAVEQSKRVSLDGEWQFLPDPKDEGVQERLYSGGRKAGCFWGSMNVPGRWDEHGHPDFKGPGWFRRQFAYTPPADSEHTGICIVGITDSCRVWINDREVTSRSTPFRRFAFDIDNVARPGINSLTVRVHSPDGWSRGLGHVCLQRYRQFDEMLRGEHYGKPARVSADWVRDAVIYEVYLRSFSPEGTFAGLQAKLDDLKAMGVTVLWLMPIHPVGEERRKGTLGSPYSVTDFRAVNPEFGTMEDFKSLLAATHERGMKLIIDLVANHTAWDCSLIKEHPEWYKRDKKGDIKSPVPDWSDVAQLDYDQPEVRRAMAGVMRFWIDEIGIDGFRCDVAGMVPLDFWTEVCRELDAIKPVLMLAEDDNPAEHLAAFDMTYDWRTYYPLGDFVRGTVLPSTIKSILDEQELDFPTGSLRMRFSDNHDMCAWGKPAAERYGPVAEAAAAVLTFVLPGVPLIYNGQETGNTAKLGLFERIPIDWSGTDHGMKRLYADLSKLRRERPSLRGNEVRFLEIPAKRHVLALVRSAGGESTLALINFTPIPRTVELGKEIPGKVRTLLAGPGVKTQPPAGAIELPPFGYWFGEERGE